MATINMCLRCHMLCYHTHTSCPGPSLGCGHAVRPNPQPTGLNYILYLSAILHSNPRNSIVLVGDFNLPAVKWDSLTATSSACRNFCDFIFDNDFLQINDKPTHTGGNILDLIITNSDDCVRNLAIHSSGHLVISDHFTLTFQLSTPQPSYSCYVPMLNYDYPEADYNGLCSYLLLRLLSMSSVARCWISVVCNQKCYL